MLKPAEAAPEPASPAAADVAPLRPKADRANSRILVVDDDELSGLTIATWLEHQGYPAERANGPGEAAKRLTCQKFALILSDVQMPGNFRLEWVERQLKAPDSPPILLLTGSPDLETACRAANLPVAGYLLKPVNFAEVDQLIQRVLGERETQREFAAVADQLAGILGAQSIALPQEDFQLIGQLTALASSLAARGGRPTRAAGAANTWRDAIHETIEVLEKTKHSFRSKELGGLRQRLQKLLQDRV